MKEKYIAIGVMALVVAIGCALHFYRIGYPDQPVFDEVHFATYAADYATGHAFEDIHPPLGKLIFAAVLSLYPPGDLIGANYIDFTHAPDGSLLLMPRAVPFGDFPYVALRVVSALFGIALPVALYFLMRNLGAGPVPASLAATFALFDNALLVNSRLILMDSMMLLFGVTALALYFHRHRFAIAAGAFFGLALAVKLTAIVFVAPVAAAYLLALVASKKERSEEFARAARFAVVGFSVLAAVSLIGTFYFSPSARMQALHVSGFDQVFRTMPDAAAQAAHPFGTYLMADIGEMGFSVAGYTMGDAHDAESPWYFWPAMQSPISFYSPASGGAGGSITLTGNPVVWYGSTLAVIFALALLYRYGRDYIKHAASRVRRYPFLILLAGYVGAMAPFILIVHRSTFLYHYFPALVFAIGLLGWLIGEWLEVREWKNVTAPKAIVLAVILLIVIAGFLRMAPVTYGL